MLNVGFNVLNDYRQMRGSYQGDLYSFLAEKYHLKRNDVKSICYALAYGVERQTIRNMFKKASS